MRKAERRLQKLERAKQIAPGINFAILLPTDDPELFIWGQHENLGPLSEAEIRRRMGGFRGVLLVWDMPIPPHQDRP